MKLEVTKSGLYTVKINGKYLNSKYDPQSESEKFINGYKHLFDKSKIVIYGLGLGYHVKALLDNINQDIKVYVFEYNLDIIELCKRVNKELFNRKNLFIISASDRRFLEKFAEALKECEDIIIHKPSLESIKDTNTKLYRLLDNYIISKSSIDKFADKLAENSEINKKQNLIPISMLIEQNKKNNGNFIIISSGPSLDMEIEHLKSYKNKFTIIAVGSSLRTLMKNNIVPDFVVITDCQDIVYNQIRGFENVNIPICFLNTSSAVTIQKYNGPKYVFFNEDKLEKESLKTGKTVAVSAIDLALKCNAENIIMIGQDLALIDGRSHTNTYKETYGVEDVGKRTRASENVKSYDGHIIKTRRSYLLFKMQIENLIRESGNVKFYNCSKGAFIEGAEHIDFIDYLKKAGDING